jgi:hypothetical protein
VALAQHNSMYSRSLGRNALYGGTAHLLRGCCVFRQLMAETLEGRCHRLTEGQELGGKVTTLGDGLALH